MPRSATPIDYSKHYQVGTNEEFCIIPGSEHIKISPSGKNIRYVDIQFIRPNSLGFTSIKRSIELSHINIGRPVHDPYLFDLPLNKNEKIACFGDPNDPILAICEDYEKQYYMWQSIIKSCYDPEANNYKSHGGQGVRVCLNWRVFTLFLKDMINLPNYDKWLADSANWTLSTVKVCAPGEVADYCPENCALVPMHTTVFKTKYACYDNNYYGVGINNTGSEYSNYYLNMRFDDANIYMLYDNEIAAAAMFNYIAKLNGFTDDKLNQLPREVSFNEVRNAAIPQKHVNATHQQLYHRLAFYNDDVDARARQFIQDHCKPTQSECI